MQRIQCRCAQKIMGCCNSPYNIQFPFINESYRSSFVHNWIIEHKYSFDMRNRYLISTYSTQAKIRTSIIIFSCLKWKFLFDQENTTDKKKCIAIT